MRLTVGSLVNGRMQSTVWDRRRPWIGKQSGNEDKEMSGMGVGW